MTEGSKSQGPDVYEQIMTRSGIRAVQAEHFTDDCPKNVFLTSGSITMPCVRACEGLNEMACEAKLPGQVWLRPRQ